MIDEDKSLSPAMTSALQAVARLKGNFTVVWVMLAERDRDDRFAPDADDPRQGWKPTGR